MSVHYKFKSATTSETIKFDGVHISVSDLKQAICQQKKLGKGRDSELQIRNAETDEVYSDDKTLVPKNASLIVQRVPNPHYSKHAARHAVNEDDAYDPYEGGMPTAMSLRGELGVSADASEEEKIKAMMYQSTQDYDPSRYKRIRGAGQYGPVPANYVCHRCKRKGHWIRNCPFPDGETKRTTGIPNSFLIKVDGPSVPGAMLTPTGEYAVMRTTEEAYSQKRKKDPPPFAVLGDDGTGHGKQKENREPSLVCSICDDYAKEAVKVPCCFKVYCDDCIRQKLVEDQTCTNCNAIDLPPTSLRPAVDERLRIRLIRSKAEGVISQQDLARISSELEQLPEVPKNHAESDEDIQEVTPPKRRRRNRDLQRPRAVNNPQEIVLLDDDDGKDGGKDDDLVVLDDDDDVVVAESLPGPSRRRVRRNKGNHDEIVVL